jgi:hypothetical protein
MRPSGTKRPLLFALALLALLALLVAAGHGRFQQLSRHDGETLPVADCDLNTKPCVATLPDGGEMRVAITPRPIPTLAPLDIRVSLRGGVAETVQEIQLDLSGVEMEMGWNRVRLERTAAGAFQGKANLPVCLSGRMHWQAAFLLNTRNGPLTAAFQFESGG